MDEYFVFLSIRADDRSENELLSLYLVISVVASEIRSHVLVVIL